MGFLNLNITARYKKIVNCILFSSLLANNAIHAEELDSEFNEQAGWSDAELIIFFEIGYAAMIGAAAEQKDPKSSRELFGGMLLLSSPLMGSSEYYPYEIGGMAAMGLYNVFELSKEDYSNSEFFWYNFVSQNIYWGIRYYREVTNKVAIVPIKKGVALNYYTVF